MRLILTTPMFRLVPPGAVPKGPDPASVKMRMVLS
jgi:hypothetical protein